MNSGSKLLDIETIKQILPHRYPFLMIDRVLDYEVGNYLKAVKNISVNEPFFQGHFPDEAVMPGVLMIEAFAQAAAVLGIQDFEDGKLTNGSLVYLAGVDKARFRKPAVPGDQLIIEVKFLTRKRNIWKYEAAGYVDSKLIAAAELMTTAIIE